MRVFSVPSSVPFLRTVVAALVDGRLVEGFEARARAGEARRRPRSICRPGAPTCGARNLPGRTRRQRRWCCPASSRSATSTKTNWLSPRRTNRIGGAAALEIPPKLGELERRLTLARLVAAWAKSPVSAPLVVGGPASTLALAGDLARLMDDMVTRGVEWNALDGLVPDQLDQYWQFARVPADRTKGSGRPIFAEIGKIEPAARRDLPDRGGSQAPGRAIMTVR